MAVDSVNGNNNTALYTGIGVVAGAGAGAAAGYLTRPFLKDGAPTDEFVKKIEYKLVTSDLAMSRTDLIGVLDRFRTLEELKFFYVLKTMNNFDAQQFDYIQSDDFTGTLDEYQASLKRLFKEIDFELDDEDIEKIKNIKNSDGVELFLKEDLDKSPEFQGISLEDAKKELLARVDEFKKKEAKGAFKSVWDTKEKKFVNCEDCVGKAVKDAARSIQGKYALIYGSIGAAVLGLGTYLFAHGKSSKADAVESQSAK